MNNSVSLKPWNICLSAVLLASVAGCNVAPASLNSDQDGFSDRVDAQLSAAQTKCLDLATARGVPDFQNATTLILSATLVPEGEGADTAPAHCDVEGEINRRTSPVDGQEYAIRFRMRLPVDQWNGRFLQLGGGGSNGKPPTALGGIPGEAPDGLARGFAVIATDAGHNNETNYRAGSGGAAAFGMDPQARRDHFYNAYDEVAQAGKVLTEWFYASEPTFSYFVGCSEGGREAMLMSQRFPDYFDGIIAGAPQFLQPMQSLSSVAGTQVLAEEAGNRGLIDADGRPAINKVFSDKDLDLAASAIRAACDGLDGLEDGLVYNIKACTTESVMAELERHSCDDTKTDECLLLSQISVLKALHAPARNSAGEILYPGFPWDPGVVSAQSGFRAWWLGDYEKDSSNSVRFRFSPMMLEMVWHTPPRPFKADDAPDIALEYDYASMSANPAENYPATEMYPDAPGRAMVVSSTDLSAFKASGGKLMVWAGVADPTHSLYQTTDWVDRMRNLNGERTNDFLRMFTIPGMAHCRGGPTTDQFDLLQPLMDWVEAGQPPKTILAQSSKPLLPGNEPVARPLCTWPSYARYDGIGSSSDASSFVCVTE
ncbi:tannase/feruloyl esterase family alpha/beta hydrolase [uncultured Hyphomonas sp.]|uniref:tannase/feruloyl esterase family alpha/beta hydrolase n=1 Tax=uncultured Hyphomonas sp. TaxID=225298 RepID=UPI002AAB3BB6|nr:tannase/feruloyl esterase family alpha/beta hydrolase [uncultured Hyphomonas sp.]